MNALELHIKRFGEMRSTQLFAGLSRSDRETIAAFADDVAEHTESMELNELARLLSRAVTGDDCRVAGFLVEMDRAALDLAFAYARTVESSGRIGVAMFGARLMDAIAAEMARRDLAATKEWQATAQLQGEMLLHLEGVDFSDDDTE